MEAKDIVEKEVARQREFGYEPSWEDFVIAGIEAGIREENERILNVIATYGLKAFLDEKERELDKRHFSKPN